MLLAVHPNVEDLEHELVEGHQVSQCSPLGCPRVVRKTRGGETGSQISRQGVPDLLEILGVEGQDSASHGRHSSGLHQVGIVGFGRPRHP